MELVLLAGLVFVPPVATLFLRSNGVLVFLGVCLGSVLAMYVAGDASSVISSANRTSPLATMQWTQLTLLIVPVVLTILLSRKKMRGTNSLLSLAAAMTAGCLLALFAVPYLSAGQQSTIRATELWRQLDNLQTAFVILGAGVTVLYLFVTRWKPQVHKKHHK
ncbi:hypothetical protein CSA80_03105 [Candidatus Saccharibacteria bacterium]|nr:MAG: hypothetical protein CR973_00260 [Candidatus Saccharibacteria bacterium]PID99077.1 MAG: hypothetical protein CSA80_03105 [Candidatus Saccharibacteria bacterium]